MISRLTDTNHNEQPNSDYLVSLDSVGSRKLIMNGLASGSNQANHRASAALIESWNHCTSTGDSSSMAPRARALRSEAQQRHNKICAHAAATGARTRHDRIEPELAKAPGGSAVKTLLTTSRTV